MILHITSDFNHTKVHSELIKSLDKRGIEQTVFVPLKKIDVKGKNEFLFKCDTSYVVYSEKLAKYHRVFFKSKINLLYKSLKENVLLNNIKLTHASTLFSDGAIAFRLFSEYGIPYVVAIRSTDIDFFIRYRIDLIPLCKKILKNASSIIFISEASRRKFYRIKPLKSIMHLIQDKFICFHNGIDDYWIDNVQKYRKVSQEQKTFKFIFVGEYSKRKNCVMLIKALDRVREVHGLDVVLDLVGRESNESDLILKEMNGKSWIINHGEVNDKKVLIELLRKADFFSLVSHTETFGLVYIEALSQGKPVLYTKNEGIDNLFEFIVGEGASSRDLVDLENKILNLVSNDYCSINDIDFNNFRWNVIGGEYHKLYSKIIDKRNLVLQ